MTANYASSQQRGPELTEKIRKIVKEEVRRALKSARRAEAKKAKATPRAGKTKARKPVEAKPLSPQTFTLRSLAGQPLTLTTLGTSIARPEGSAARALNAAEKAIEKDESLSKKQRVAALKAIAAAKQAIGSGETGGKNDGTVRGKVFGLPKGAGQLRLSHPSGSGGGAGRTDLYFDGRKQDEGSWEGHVVPKVLEGTSPKVYWFQDGRWTAPPHFIKAQSKPAKKRRKQTSKIL